MNEDYGRRDWELPCICGHLKDKHKNPHSLNDTSLIRHCVECWPLGFRHKFQLDNLSYIEDLAKERGLV
jgi:hypothetical protein